MYQRRGKVSKITEGDNIRVQACNDPNVSSQFTRIIQHKNLPWEKDSIAKVAYDPAHIPDRECVLFIGTQFSNLYTAVDTPAKGRVGAL